MPDSNIRRFLLLLCDGYLSVVEHSRGCQKIMLFDGEKRVEYRNSLWEVLMRKACMEQGQRNDFCLISDALPLSLPKKQSASAISSGSVWNAHTIESAVKLIDPHHSLTISAESGVVLCEYTSMFSVGKPYRLTAHYAGSAAYGLTDPNGQPDEIEIIIPSYEAREGGLTDEEYKQASALCRVFVDENRAAAQRGKR